MNDAYFTYDMDGPYRQCEESYKPIENHAINFTTNVIAALKGVLIPKLQPVYFLKMQYYLQLYLENLKQLIRTY